MTERYLLDTNILSDFIRNPHGEAAQRYQALRDDQLCTSIVVAAELRYGAANRRSRYLAQRVAETLDGIEIVPLESPVDSAYAQLRVELERTGNLIGPNDLLIAAQAVALGLILVTDNEREFSRVSGLKIENWLRPLPN